MSGGEKMYDALMKGVVKSITFNWEPEWSDFAQPLYEAFVEDAMEDLRIIALTPRHDKETGELFPDTEVAISCWISEVDDTLSRPFALSDILVDLYENTDEEDFEIILERSIAKARKEIAERNSKRLEERRKELEEYQLRSCL
jgi:hypothetical protein